MRRTIVQSFLAALALLGLGIACAAESAPHVEAGRVDAPSESQVVPMGLDRPIPLAEGDVCVGVVSRVIPNSQSGGQPYWGCFEAGAIDRAFTPGVLTPPPILLPLPSSELQFDASELERLEEHDEDLEEGNLPDLEIIRK